MNAMATNYRSLGRPYFAIALILSFIVIMVMVICGTVSITNLLNEAQHQTDIVSQENPTFINCLLGSNSACSPNLYRYQSSRKNAGQSDSTWGCSFGGKYHKQNPRCPTPYKTKYRHSSSIQPKSDRR